MHKRIKQALLFQLYLFLFFPYISKEQEKNEIQTNYSYIEFNMLLAKEMLVFFIKMKQINFVEISLLLMKYK